MIGGHDFQRKPTASLNQRATYNRGKQTDLIIIDNGDDVSKIMISVFETVTALTRPAGGSNGGTV